uniref:Lectizyme n=1 Tax=Glossina morsitans morsitans TaxID=37546 RepID=A0A1B0FGH4_GLOMM
MLTRPLGFNATTTEPYREKGRGPMNSDDIEVVAGTPKRLQKVNTTQSSIAEKLVVHRRYVSFSVQYDIGLIKLKDEFKLNEYAVAAISLPKSAPVDGLECTLLGWGRMYQNGPLPDAVLYVSLDLLTYKSCKQRLIIINEGNICGWDPNNNMKGACNGDSGGPLICDDCVTGIVSYGMDCDVGVPDAYTNVHYFLKWIKKNMAYKITSKSEFDNIDAPPMVMQAEFIFVNFLFLGFVNAGEIFNEDASKIRHNSSEKNFKVKKIANEVHNDTYLVNMGFTPRDVEQIYTKYVVSIQHANVEHMFGEHHICGGSILAPGLILTAAYCLFIPEHGPIDPEGIKVVAGTPNRVRRAPTTQIVEADDIVVHPRYSRSSGQYDIALIKLKSELKFNRHAVSAIPLPKSAPLQHDVCWFVGWGRLYENGPMADEIQGNTIEVLTYASCARTAAPLNDGILCAFDEHHVEKGACKGDSGGPLICNGAVSGIVSSRENCDWGVPTALTNVYYFLEWIEKNVAQKNNPF